MTEARHDAQQAENSLPREHAITLREQRHLRTRRWNGVAGFTECQCDEPSTLGGPSEPEHELGVACEPMLSKCAR